MTECLPNRLTILKEYFQEIFNDLGHQLTVVLVLLREL